MLGLKLNHVSKKGHMCSRTGFPPLCESLITDLEQIWNISYYSRKDYVGDKEQVLRLNKHKWVDYISLKVDVVDQ